MRILSANMKRKHRNKIVFVKTTADEHATFNKLALTRHTNLSELVRQLLHREVAAQSKEQAA